MEIKTSKQIFEECEDNWIHSNDTPNDGYIEYSIAEQRWVTVDDLIKRCESVLGYYEGYRLEWQNLKMELEEKTEK